MARHYHFWQRQCLAHFLIEAGVALGGVVSGIGRGCGRTRAVRIDQVGTQHLPWTGRRMAVAKFIPHLRNEHALHRWDIAGDDETSLELLGDMDFVGHSVGELSRILYIAGRADHPDPDAEFHVRLRTEGQRDLRVIVENGDATLAWASDQADEPVVDIDAGARQLFIWGRRPDHRGRLRSHLTQPDLARLQALLSGY